MICNKWTHVPALTSTGHDWRQGGLKLGLARDARYMTVMRIDCLKADVQCTCRAGHKRRSAPTSKDGVAPDRVDTKHNQPKRLLIDPWWQRVRMCRCAAYSGKRTPANRSLLRRRLFGAEVERDVAAMLLDVLPPHELDDLYHRAPICDFGLWPPTNEISHPLDMAREPAIGSLFCGLCSMTPVVAGSHAPPPRGCRPLPSARICGASAPRRQR